MAQKIDLDSVRTAALARIERSERHVVLPVVLQQPKLGCLDPGSLRRRA